MQGTKQIQQLARQYFRLSLQDGLLSEERVSAVLTCIARESPKKALVITSAYKRLVEREVARSRAVVEHAGPISDGAITAIASAMAKFYSRPVTASAKSNPELIAGMRVRIGDDVFESSVAAQLQALSV